MEVIVAVGRLSDNVLVDNLLVAAAIITALATVATIFWKAIKPFKERIDAFLDWQEEFRPQWEGMDAEKPGDISHPGVMQRLSRIDGEFQRNGGSSMKDAIVRLTDDVEAVSKDMNEVRQELCKVSATLQEVYGDGKKKST